MKTLHALSNEVSSLPTHAVEARAHGFRVVATRFGKWNSASESSEPVVGDPSAFPARRSNPHSRAATVVDDGQRPFRFQITDLAVGDEVCSEWINDFNDFIAEDELWFDPQQVGDARQNATHCQLERNLLRVGDDKKTVRRKEQDQEERGSTPDEIALGSKGFAHVPSIAGDTR